MTHLISRSHQQPAVALPSLNPNKIIIYHLLDDVDFALSSIARMIEIARPDSIESRPTGRHLQPIKLDQHSIQTTSCQLITKYYSADLCLQIVPAQEILTTTPDLHADPLALVVILDAHEQDRLLPLLKRIASSKAQSRLVIVKSDDVAIVEDDWWHETCLSEGFECHSALELTEASMSWQCCPWPRLQLHSKQVDASQVDSVLPSHLEEGGPVKRTLNDCLAIDKLSVGDEPDNVCKPSPGGVSHVRQGSTRDDTDGFEDDFAPFVSASTSLGWEESSSFDDLPTTAEVNETAQLLFGPAHPTEDGIEELDDLENLVASLNRLRDTANQMDDVSRRRFAARVAMAVEDRLSSRD